MMIYRLDEITATYMYERRDAGAERTHDENTKFKAYVIESGILNTTPSPGAVIIEGRFSR